MDLREVGFLGGAVSAVIAAVSYWAKTRHERRRTTRTVLYYLLEAHHFSCRIRYLLRGANDVLLERLKLKLTGASMCPPDDEWKTINQLLDEIIRKFAADELQSLVSATFEPFGKALAELAREDPILAFRLRGIEQFLVLTRKIDNLFVAPNSASSVEPEGSLIQGYPSIDDFFRETAVNELREAIQETAWHCDALTHYGVRSLLRRMDREQAGSELTQRLRDLADQFIDRYISEQKTKDS